MTSVERPFWRLHRLPEPLASMTKPERVAWLRERGWTRLGYDGAQTWLSPDPDDRCFYSLAAALRFALGDHDE
jgi:hypothetical protein